MSSYTIKSGDNLWNICKKQLGIKNNADIVNTIKKIANANNISNPNLIFPGQVLKLDGLEVERTTQPEQPPQAEQTVQTEEAIPVETSAPAAKKAPAVVAVPETEESKPINYNEYAQNILNEINNNQGNEVSVSNFATKALEGVESNNIFLNMLAEDDTQRPTYDTNNDGKITLQEFKDGNDKRKTSIISSYSSIPELLTTVDINSDGIFSEDEYDAQFGNDITKKTIAGIENKANIFAENLDINSNGKIDVNELAFFLEQADALDGEADGNINNDCTKDMFAAVTGMNADNPEYNTVVNKYFMGETLTPDEEEILKEAQNALRTAMSNAAGIEQEN